MVNEFLPEEFLRQVLPKSFFTKGIVTSKMKANQIVLRSLYRLNFVNNKDIFMSVFSALDIYLKKYKAIIEEEKITKPLAVKEALSSQALIKNRVENLILWSKAQEIREDRKGDYYIWLPSRSKEPRPEHQLRYGKVYQVGKGILPMEEYGCKCGLRFLTQKELNQRGLK